MSPFAKRQGRDAVTMDDQDAGRDAEGRRKAGTGRKRARRAPRGPVDPVRAQNPEAVREAALRLLERTRRTRSDLTRRLRDKGYDPAVVDTILERLTGVGLVDDVEYARAFLAGRWGRRAAGWRVLENDLRRRGVSADDIAAARAGFEAERGDVDEVAGAVRAIEQAARRYAKLEPRVRRQRLWALLSRRGFDGETIEAALRVVLTRTPEA
jgi:regulatory protein